MNYALLGQSVCVLMLMACVTERYKRSGPVLVQEIERSERALLEASGRSVRSETEARWA